MFKTIQSAALHLVQKWWRPACCLGFVAALFVHGVWLPVSTQKPADLTGLSTLIAAITAAFAVREVGKRWGTSK